MGDAARHLAEGTQPLLLEDGLLGLAELVVGLLEGSVELRLVGGERDVLAELLEKLAFAAAEGVRRGPRGQKNAEDPAFDQQRGGHERAQAGPGQPAGKGHVQPGELGLVNELAMDAAGEPVGIERDRGAVGQGQFLGEGPALRAHAGDGQGLSVAVVEAHAAKVHRQVILKAPGDDQEDAFQVLTLAGRPRDLVELGQAGELGLHLGFREFPLGDLRVQGLVGGMQGALPALDARNHVVDGIGEHADLVLPLLLGTHGVVLASGDALRGGGQSEDGSGDGALQPGRKPERHEERADEHQRRDAAEQTQPRGNAIEVHLDADRPERLAVQHDRAQHHEMPWREPMPVEFRPAGKAALDARSDIVGETVPRLGIKACRHDVGLGLQGLQNLPRGGLVLKGQRRAGILAEDVGEHYGVAGHGPAEIEDFVGGQRGAGHQEHDRAGQQDDEGQLAPDRKILQPAHVRFPPWPIRDRRSGQVPAIRNSSSGLAAGR